jgi:insecticidal toxin complex protein TccC
VSARGAMLVSSTTYDEKGRRSSLTHQGDVTRTYEYDPDTFRLTQIRTAKTLPDGSDRLYQQLDYVYDPVGNIASILDSAQPLIYFRNQLIPPEMRYTYDALYRLRTAEGREHAGQAVPDQRDVVTPFALPANDPTDLQAITAYADEYAYDASGNITLYRHTPVDPQSRA